MTLDQAREALERAAVEYEALETSPEKFDFRVMATQASVLLRAARTYARTLKASTEETA